MKSEKPQATRLPRQPIAFDLIWSGAALIALAVFAYATRNGAISFL
jgi:hypothetical protein